MTHTPAPWYVFTDGPRPYGEAEISATVGDMPVTVGFSDTANAARIVACVNACEGLTNEELASGITRKADVNAELLAYCEAAFDFLGGVDDAATIGADLLAAIAKAKP